MRARLSRLFGHTATIEPFIGEGAHGPMYGSAVTERCRLNDGRRFGRTDDRAEVVAETVLYLRAAAACPVRSRVTVNGRTFTAVRSVPRNGGSLPAPEHLEVVLR